MNFEMSSAAPSNTNGYSVVLGSSTPGKAPFLSSDSSFFSAGSNFHLLPEAVADLEEEGEAEREENGEENENGEEEGKTKEKKAKGCWRRFISGDWFPSVSHFPVDGWFGWLVVLASFLVHIVVLGSTYSFGVYFREYLVLFADYPPSQLSFIGTLSAGLFPICGIITGRLADKFGPRIVIAIGIIIFTVALVSASFSTEVWHLLLTQGVLQGIGASFCYFPAVAAVPAWFDRRRGIATGLAVAGSGVGGFAFGPFIQKLIEISDWRWALRCSALVSFFLLLLAWLLMFRREVPKKQGPWFYFDLFRDKTFTILFIGSTVATFGFLLPFYYLSVFAQTVAGLTPADGALLIGIVNGASGFGRLSLGLASDYLGRMNLLCLCMLIGSISIYSWPFCVDFASLSVFGFFFGFFGGGFISITPVVLADYYGTDRLSGVIGLFISSTSLGNLFGVSIGGMIYEASGNNFLPAGMYAATMMLFTFLCDVTVKLMKEPIKVRCLQRNS